MGTLCAEAGIRLGDTETITCHVRATMIVDEPETVIGEWPQHGKIDAGLASFEPRDQWPWIDFAIVGKVKRDTTRATYLGQLPESAAERLGSHTLLMPGQ